MKILVTGASGFIASAIIHKLTARNYDVLPVYRSQKPIGQGGFTCDFKKALSMDDWLPLVSDVDVVVNCAGILREGNKGDFQKVHNQAPTALLNACEQVGVKRFIQISALGNPEDAEFIQSKHAFDKKVLISSVEGIVIRPSVVVSLQGSYGGSSLLRGLAALPGIVFLPGDGSQTIQPVLLSDLADIVVKSVAQPSISQHLLYAVGPEIITLKTFLLATRRWLGFSNPSLVGIPLGLIRPVIKAGQYIGHGPLGETVYSLLKSGNVAASGEYEKTAESLTISPGNILHAFENEVSYVQDRWHARLYLLRPLVIVLLAFVWVASGLVGLNTPLENFKPVVDAIGVPVDIQSPLLLMTGWVDIALGAGILIESLRRRFILFMLIASLSYTFIIGFLAPQFWFEPLGGLLKNIIIFPLLLVCWVINDLR